MDQASALPSGAGALAAAERACADQDMAACAAAARQACAALDGAPAARAAYLLAHALYRKGDFRALLAHAAQAVALLRARGRVDWACEVLRYCALGASEVADWAEALKAARLGLEIAEDGRMDEQRVLAVNAHAACLERMGDPWQAERLLGDALALARERAGDVPQFVCLNNLCATGLSAYYLLRDGPDPAEAAAALHGALVHARQAQPLAARIGDPFYSAYIESNLGDVLNFLGRHAEAEGWLRSALQRARRHGFELLVWRIECSLGELALERAETAQARDILQPLLERMGSAAPPVTALRAQAALYRALRALGDTAGALEACERYYRAERLRSVRQLKGQADNLLTRLEVEQARRDAQRHRQRALDLERLATRDALTGLANRRGIERFFDEVARSGSAGGPLVAAMIDVDHFKTVNDSHGHAVGDAVLVRLAELLRDHVRPQDQVVRLGGEEFVIVWSGIATDRAVEIAERLRQAAQDLRWPGAPPDLRLTISVGVAALAHPLPPVALGDLLAEVDGTLYRAKQMGRNRVETA